MLRWIRREHDNEGRLMSTGVKQHLVLTPDVMTGLNRVWVHGASLIYRLRCLNGFSFGIHQPANANFNPNRWL